MSKRGNEYNPRVTKEKQKSPRKLIVHSPYFVSFHRDGLVRRNITRSACSRSLLQNTRSCSASIEALRFVFSNPWKSEPDIWRRFGSEYISTSKSDDARGVIRKWRQGSVTFAKIRRCTRARVFIKHWTSVPYHEACYMEFTDTDPGTPAPKSLTICYSSIL